MSSVLYLKRVIIFYLTILHFIYLCILSTFKLPTNTHTYNIVHDNRLLYITFKMKQHN